MKFDHTCSRCLGAFEVDGEFTPARYRGRMEDSEEAETNFEPSDCPHCDLDCTDEIAEYLVDFQAAAEEDYLEERAEAKRSIRDED